MSQSETPISSWIRLLELKPITLQRICWCSHSSMSLKNVRRQNLSQIWPCERMVDSGIVICSSRYCGYICSRARVNALAHSMNNSNKKKRIMWRIWKMKMLLLHSDQSLQPFIFPYQPTIKFNNWTRHFHNFYQFKIQICHVALFNFFISVTTMYYIDDLKKEVLLFLYIYTFIPIQIIPNHIYIFINY